MHTATPPQVGRYRILEQLGAGGMGTVYKAHDPQLNRVVAVKVPHFEGSPEAQENDRQRFLREARSAAGVRHPHVCPIHDVGEQYGVPYVVMSFVEGESLAQRLRKIGRFEDCREAVALVRQIGEGLAAVHAVNIVHRDLKPANVLMDRTTGQPVLTDFGLAKVLTDGEHLTADGSLLGTPAYMSPEQATLGADTVGTASDQYSLAVVLYQLVTGRLPFEGPTMSMLFQIGNNTPPPASQFRADLDPKLVAILRTAMARKPEDRYPTVQAFVGALTAWLRTAAQTAAAALKGKPLAGGDVTIPRLPGESIAADGTMALRNAPPPLPVTETIALPKPAPARRRRAMIVAVAASLLLAATSVGGWFVYHQLAKKNDSSAKNEDSTRKDDGKKEEEKKDVVKPTTGSPVTRSAPVSRPTLIDGVTTWDLVADRKEGPFNILAWSPDKSQLFLRNTSWMAWSMKMAGGLPAAPFEGSFDSLSADGRLAARNNGTTALVGENPTIPKFDTTLRGLPLGWIIYQGPRLSPNGQWAAASIYNNAQGWRLAVWSLKLSKPVVRDWSANPVVKDIWDANTGHLIFPSQQRGVEILEVGEDKNKDIVSLGLVKTMPYDNVPVYGGSLSPDGKQFASLVSPSSGPECWVWDLETKQKRIIAGINWAGNPPAWSPDGTRLACRLRDEKHPERSGNEVGLFDTATGKLLFPVAGHDYGTSDILFTADGRTLITSGGDNLIRFWNAATGDLRGTLIMLPQGHWLAISPEGHYKGSPHVEETKLFTFAAFKQGESRRHDYSPVKFEKEFGWTNNPSKVNLLGD